jgi:hypothetical protein
MFDLFKSIGDVATKTVNIALAPVEMAVDLADAALKPLSDAATELKKDIKSIKD